MPRGLDSRSGGDWGPRRLQLAALCSVQFWGADVAVRRPLLNWPPCVFLLGGDKLLRAKGLLPRLSSLPRGFGCDWRRWRKNVKHSKRDDDYLFSTLTSQEKDCIVFQAQLRPRSVACSSAEFPRSGVAPGVKEQAFPKRSLPPRGRCRWQNLQ